MNKKELQAFAEAFHKHMGDHDPKRVHRFVKSMFCDEPTFLGYETDEELYKMDMHLWSALADAHNLWCSAKEFAVDSSKE